jgi:hypothetical protein
MPGLRPARLILAVGLVAIPAMAADISPPSARKVTLHGDKLTPADAAKAIRTQAGIDVDVSAIGASKTFSLNLENVDFWSAVQQLADATGGKVATTGGRVAIRPGKSEAQVYVRGPFRFTVREPYARLDPETGKSTYEIILEVCWEPWLLAYRIDTTPTIERATSDRRQELTVAKGGSRALTSGNIATLTVRPAATRADKTITLAGSIRVTIADKLLTFTFDADKPQPVPSQEGIEVRVRKSGADGPNWFAEIEVKNPAGGVTVESHEYELLRHNTARLIPPKGDPIPADLVEAADLRYGFKNRANQVGPGWKLEYRTPGPMREIVVPFELKDIRLP